MGIEKENIINDLWIKFIVNFLVYSSFEYILSLSDVFNSILNLGIIKKEKIITNLSSDLSIIIIIYMNFK